MPHWAQQYCCYLNLTPRFFLLLTADRLLTVTIRCRKLSMAHKILCPTTSLASPWNSQISSSLRFHHCTHRSQVSLYVSSESWQLIFLSRVADPRKWRAPAILWIMSQGPQSVLNLQGQKGVNKMKPQSGGQDPHAAGLGAPQVTLTAARSRRHQQGKATDEVPTAVKRGASNHCILRDTSSPKWNRNTIQLCAKGDADNQEFKSNQEPLWRHREEGSPLWR